VSDYLIELPGEYVEGMSDAELLDTLSDVVRRGEMYQHATGLRLTVELQRRTFARLVSREG
jgi:hypothetical protein